MAVGRWISPALADALGSLLPERFQRFEVVQSWDEAERRCLGYEQSVLSSRAPSAVPGRAKVERPTARDVQFVAALGICLQARQSSSRVRVLDFGGAFGHYLDVARSAFPNLTWDWTVVETPTVVALAAGREADRSICWTSDLDSALDERWDLVLASASLNYVPDPVKALRQFGQIAPYALLTRLPLWPVERHLPAVQRLSRRDRAGAYPTWVFSEAEFLDEVGAAGDVVFRFDIPEDTARMAGHRGTYCGLLVRAREASS